MLLYGNLEEGRCLRICMKAVAQTTCTGRHALGVFSAIAGAVSNWAKLVLCIGKAGEGDTGSTGQDGDGRVQGEDARSYQGRGR